jgi:hypothetical protein
MIPLWFHDIAKYMAVLGSDDKRISYAEIAEKNLEMKLQQNTSENNHPKILKNICRKFRVFLATSNECLQLV